MLKTHVSALGLLFGLVVAPRAAKADVSSWLYVAPGASWTKQGTQSTQSQPTLQLDTGLGTPPAHTVIFGGILHWQTHFGHGTDLGLLLRTATHGFVNGGWGAAIDLGGYERWWELGSAGGMGQLVLGAPWGITLAAGGGKGTNQGQHMSVTLGIDLARLTVYRRTGESWWKNPFPAYRPEEE
ncbi:MAG: hypothetical protein IPI67_40690 [Myxococcales bacterium]|nr:hypothetical protein [Myxococcales bacterium]